jgi:hypothetical protein
MEHGEDNDKAKVKIAIDLTKLEVEKDADHTNKFPLFDDVGVVMKYPTIKVMSKMQNLEGDNVESIFEIIADCVDYIYQGDELHYGSEQSKEDLLQFLNNLTSEQFGNIQKFFSTMPKIRKHIEYNCPVCGKANSMTLEGMQSFF